MQRSISNTYFLSGDDSYGDRGCNGRAATVIRSAGLRRKEEAELYDIELIIFLAQ